LCGTSKQPRRFQPTANTHHPQTKAYYQLRDSAKNNFPKHIQMMKEGDHNALAKERIKQSLHSMAETYPEFRDGEWKYLFPPLLPNWRPLPGRVTDNQQRWVQETVQLCPWFQDLYDEWLAGRQSSTGFKRTEQTALEEEAVKKLCSSAYAFKYKKTLLKIMAMPLMEHEGDIFNDAVRVTALTIDIRAHQDELFYRRMESRGIFRHTSLLYKQRQYVLDRLRRNNFKLYCKTMKHLNIEHHGRPVYNTLFHKEMAMRIVDMKLRVMHHIENEAVRNAQLRQRMAELQEMGEEKYEEDKEVINKTNELVEQIMNIKANIDVLIPNIEQEFAETEAHFGEKDERQREQFLTEYLSLMKLVNDLNSSMDHPDRHAPPIARMTKDFNPESLTATETLEIVGETLDTATKILEQCKRVQTYINMNEQPALP